MSKVISVKDAMSLIKDDSCLAVGGFAGTSVPEELCIGLKEHFLEAGTPKNLMLMYCAAPGDGKERGVNHLAQDGLLKKVIGGHWGLAPKIGAMAVSGKVEAYNFPQGIVSQIMRARAGGKPFLISRIGLDTFVDPRLSGGKVNDISKIDHIKVIEIDGEEYLKYDTFPVDVCFLRGTTADEHGNISMEHEANYLEMISMAAACKNSGGIVIVQVKRITKAGTLNPQMVKLPGVMVDHVVIAKPENHPQTFAISFDAGICGELVTPLSTIAPLKLNERKIIARRAFLELKDGANINLGIGMPEGVGAVASEEGTIKNYNFSIEAGLFGGMPLSGASFGSSMNPECFVDQTYMFDFYQGGFLKQTFLGLAQVDQFGNLNVSRFGPSLKGSGGFIDISQSTKNVHFLGTFTAGGLETEIKDGKLKILKEGREQKFVANVEQITFSAKYAKKTGQKVMYITERCVFELEDGKLLLTEIAPGIDLERDILSNMGFKPEISKNLKEMDSKLFKEGSITK